jgi:hypothetical protein
MIQNENDLKRDGEGEHERVMQVGIQP